MSVSRIVLLRLQEVEDVSPEVLAFAAALLAPVLRPGGSGKPYPERCGALLALTAPVRCDRACGHGGECKSHYSEHSSRFSAR